jgi:putative protein-disulfide isomerase
VTVVHVISYTDPACPWSWGAEPAVRRLQGEFGDGVRFTYVMGGLAREFAHPLETLEHVIDAGAATGMPVDARMWLHDHPRSSYPACLAVEAAAEQDLAGPALRRLRLGLMCEGRRLDTRDALAEALREVPGMDLARLRRDLQSSAIMERFGADLDRVRSAAPEHHTAAHRVPLPSFEVVGAGGLYEDVAPDALSELVRRAGGEPVERRPTVAEALRRFGPLAAVEVAQACGLPLPRAQAELWGLALEFAARAVRYPGGELWSVA